MSQLPSQLLWPSVTAWVASLVSHKKLFVVNGGDSMRATSVPSAGLTIRNGPAIEPMTRLPFGEKGERRGRAHTIEAFGARERVNVGQRFAVGAVVHLEPLQTRIAEAATIEPSALIAILAGANGILTGSKRRSPVLSSQAVNTP